MTPPRAVRRNRTLFMTAARYALIEHLRNRFAMVLIALFIPVWTALAFGVSELRRCRSDGAGRRRRVGRRPCPP